MSPLNFSHFHLCFMLMLNIAVVVVQSNDIEDIIGDYYWQKSIVELLKSPDHHIPMRECFLDFMPSEESEGRVLRVLSKYEKDADLAEYIGEWGGAKYIDRLYRAEPERTLVKMLFWKLSPEHFVKNDEQWEAESGKMNARIREECTKKKSQPIVNFGSFQWRKRAKREAKWLKRIFNKKEKTLIKKRPAGKGWGIFKRRRKTKIHPIEERKVEEGNAIQEMPKMETKMPKNVKVLEIVKKYEKTEKMSGIMKMNEKMSKNAEIKAEEPLKEDPTKSVLFGANIVLKLKERPEDFKKEEKQFFQLLAECICKLEHF